MFEYRSNIVDGKVLDLVTNRVVPKRVYKRHRWVGLSAPSEMFIDACRRCEVEHVMLFGQEGTEGHYYLLPDDDTEYHSVPPCDPYGLEKSDAD